MITTASGDSQVNTAVELKAYIGIVVSVASVGHGAHADTIDIETLPDLTDRNYGIDLYQGSVLGSVRIVGMGGAAVATAEGSAGMLANPASPAVRSATANDKWEWDWHLDWLNPDLGSDFDNNGIETTEPPSVFPILTGGVVVQRKQTAIGIALTRLEAPTTTSDTGQAVSSAFQVVRIIVAQSRREDQLTVGLGLRVGTFSFETRRSGANDRTLFEISGVGLEAGAVWRPTNRNIRIGGALSFPVAGTDLSVQECDPLNCEGYILPDRIAVPWRLAGGFAWRTGATTWNRTVNGNWRDERALILAADIAITGAVNNAYGVEAFAHKKLQASGRNAVMSVRSGAEYEWLPGRLRLRAGAYWEPGRFQGVGGRPHATLGVEGRIWSFCFWGERYRLRMSLTTDFAKRYGNTGLSVGFWH